MRIGVWLVAALAVLLWSAALHAHPAIDAARAAYDDGEFIIALARLEDAERDPKLTEADLAMLHWYRAACYMGLEDDALADAQFDRLIMLQPLFVPNPVDAAPPLLQRFVDRRRAYEQRHGVTLANVRLERAQLTMDIERNAESVRSVAVFIRPSGMPTFKELRFDVGGPCVDVTVADLALWEEAGRVGGVEFVVEARNARGAAVARAGNAQVPLVRVLSEEDSRAIQQRFAPPPAPTPAAPAPVSAAPDDSMPWRGPTLGAGALLAGGAGLGLLLALGTGALSTLAWAGLYAHPREVGADRSWSYRTLYYGWLALMGVALLLTAGGAMLGVAGVGTAALGALL